MNAPRSHLGVETRAFVGAVTLLVAEGLLRVVAFAVAVVVTGALVTVAGAILLPDVYPHIQAMAYNFAGVPVEARSPASPESLRALRADLLTVAIWLAAAAAALYALLLLAGEVLRPLLQRADSHPARPEAAA